MPESTTVVAKMLREDGEDEIADELEQREEQAEAERWPEPTHADIAALHSYLRDRFQRFHGSEGDTEPSTGSYDTGLDTVRRIRQIRYGLDEMPAKLKRNLQFAYRVRSMLTHQEIESVVALLGRNPIRFTVPPSGKTNKDRERADRQTRWLQHLIRGLERQASRPIVQPADDALAETSVMAAELYLSTAWDHIDFEIGDDELPEDYVERMERQRIAAGLPFGLRPIDPLALYFDDPTGEGGNPRALIVERKRYDDVYHNARRRMGDDWKEDALPRPRADGVPEGSDYGVNAEVETIRYYDSYWYAYLVGGRVIEIKPHGFPFMPVIIEIGGMTSASTFPEQFHGVTWGRASLEQALNDMLTHELDARITYDRPMPVFEADEGATDITNGAPMVLNVQPGMALPPGYRMRDAFEGFAKTENDPITGLLMNLHRQGGISSVAQGDSPGADSSGYVVNLLMSASLARYKDLLNAKQRFWARVGDLIRLAVRDTIGEPVPLYGAEPHEAHGRWLWLDPDDIDGTPCDAEIDPLDDTNRIAIEKWLESGVMGGWVSEQRLMREGFGVESVEEERAEIDRDHARRALRELRVKQAMAEIAEQEQAEQQPPMILGPNGQPISTASLQQAGGLPADMQPPTVGAGAMEAQRAADPMPGNAGTAGQQPTGRGTAPQFGGG